MSKMRLTGAQIVWKCLEREGVDTVFGYPGGCVLPLYDALQHTPSIHHVLVRHEQGAAHMADGYSRATGKVGVALATSGPGATNLVTGIATAMLDSSPIVCLTGQVGSKFIGTDAFQEIDITGITMPITKHNYMVTDVNDIARTLREAFIIARTGRPGPVLVDITKDAQMASCDFEWESAMPQLRKLETWDAPDSTQMAEAAALDQQGRAPGDSCRTRNSDVGRDAGPATVRRDQRHSGGSDVAGIGRVSALPSAVSGHDGHARRGVVEPCDPEPPTC